MLNLLNKFVNFLADEISDPISDYLKECMDEDAREIQVQLCGSNIEE